MILGGLLSNDHRLSDVPLRQISCHRLIVGLRRRVEVLNANLGLVTIQSDEVDILVIVHVSHRHNAQSVCIIEPDVNWEVTYRVNVFRDLSEGMSGYVPLACLFQNFLKSEMVYTSSSEGYVFPRVKP